LQDQLAQIIVVDDGNRLEDGKPLNHSLPGFRPLLQRVAAFLLLMVPRSPGYNEIELSMSRRDVADYLGLTIETVSRTMTQFEKEAVIGLASTRRSVLQDRAAL
jgi:CRP/FNR family nitrogen fixation transcriptional regulator